MKRSTTILLESEERINMIDSLNRLVQEYDNGSQTFDDNTKNNIKAEAAECINNFFQIIKRVYLGMGIAHTLRHVSEGQFLQPVALPQFDTMEAIQHYFGVQLAALKAAIIEEQIVNSFISDDADTLNTVIAKTDAFQVNEEDILASLTVMIASLAGDNPDSAIS